jgi:hypothetical protein
MVVVMVVVVVVTIGSVWGVCRRERVSKVRVG